ncbi:three component toxin-antitoxin-antitoxin system antitoxin SpoIISC [Bacillus spizizenii]|uniref:three component toxin-antitoxin-antitoxin system antitoxin SpoIISC n=1 Tax=Bacillus spizizenii TaxID=96241 RepID=UPI000EAA5D02|nr:three component toxin-antitoxin-antitoxin system antitoxin SpoIISC [Bacillus spizizenii]MCY7863704.1 three component toxin-antitoxin-antitoxin system antitoxin SpoIISC [Bacillus spizizenii]MCY7878964.1 three component toxin-antitoxin-antitoxin system antitoxin SpoIISC [Bacillus spizizenii]MCY8187279.1 three component toxin-antitoxin-antitoxin system antitoxin SpoIISC [Bacillus spizizenii]MCY8395787.1 three component toxin-antitoxin-antitoxin system antitoxin SpoIISC [Bacillus spizizenii]MCY
MSGDTVKKLVRRVKFVDYGKFGLSGYSLRVRERSATVLKHLKKRTKKSDN